MAELATLKQKPAEVAHNAVEMIREHKPMIDSAVKRVDEYTPLVFLGLTLGSIIGSLVLFMKKSKQEGIFIGLWAPTFLALGMFYSLIGIKKKHAD